MEEINKREEVTNGVGVILRLICQLYGVWSIDENASFFLKYRFYTPNQMDLVSAKVSPSIKYNGQIADRQECLC